MSRLKHHLETIILHAILWPTLACFLIYQTVEFIITYEER